MAKILEPYGELDCLFYYSKVASVLAKFIHGKEIATKTTLKDFSFLKRGSNSSPLFIEDLKEVDDKMLKLRRSHLNQARDNLTAKQILIWQYFVPRKPVNFFYACNGEKPGGPIDRIFIDIDRQSNSSEDARKVCLSLVNIIKKDNDFAKLLKFKIFIMWTGSSFHVYLMLNKKVNLKFYLRYLSYGKGKDESFIMKWADDVKIRIGLNVKAGHQREKKAIILDSSGTPSGKLARAPFSLHMKGMEIDGIAVPVSEKQLGNGDLIDKLRKLTADDIVKNLNSYSKLIP